MLRQQLHREAPLMKTLDSMHRVLLSSRSCTRGGCRRPVGTCLAAALLCSWASAQSECLLADITGDGIVNGSDLSHVLAAWGSNGQGKLSTDLNNDGLVDGKDLGLLLAAWGTSLAVPAWATLIELCPDPTVVTNLELRRAIIDTGLAWRVRDTMTQVELVLVPPGSFSMGCVPSDESGCLDDEIPVHVVMLANPCYLGRYEVTQAQWLARIGSNPSVFQGFADSPLRPVERVSWMMLQAFFDSTGDPKAPPGLRLPTEAEWEFGYRAGTITAYHGTPDTPEGIDAEAQVGDIAWYLDNAGHATHPVGSKRANGLGIHDMSGNVWEWVNDRYDFDYYVDSPIVDPSGPTNGLWVVQRGGGFKSSAASCRASQRTFDDPANQTAKIGFRVARTP